MRRILAMKKRLIYFIVWCIMAAAIITGLFAYEPRILGAASESISMEVHFQPDYSQKHDSKSMVVHILLISREAPHELRDFTVHAVIKDPAGKVISESSQTIAVEKTASIIIELEMPRKLESSSYELFTEVTDSATSTIVSSSSQKIFVIEEGVYIKIDERGSYYIMGIAITLIILLIIIIISHVHNHYMDEAKTADMFKYNAQYKKMKGAR